MANVRVQSRAVAVYPAAGVDEHDLARLDHPRAGVVVRQRRVRAARDDGLERDRLRAPLPHGALDPPGDLGLRPPDNGLAREPLQRVVQDGRGTADGVELLRILRRPDALDHLPGRHQLGAAFRDRRVGRVRDVVGLEGDGTRGESAQPDAQVAREIPLDQDRLYPDTACAASA